MSYQTAKSICGSTSSRNGWQRGWFCRQSWSLTAEFRRLLTVLLLGTILSSASGQTICPEPSKNCQYTGYDLQYIYGMQCANLGTLEQLPLACTYPLIVRELTIDPTATTITTIQAEILAGLRVRNLVLMGLGIESVNQSAFTALSGDLEALSLDHNRLTTLPEQVFSSLTSLTRLELRGNKLTSINRGLFDGLVNLVYLDLTFNQIELVAADTWSALPQLTVLKLENNLLTGSLNSTLFTDLTALEEVQLENNLITDIASDAFHNLTNLRRLHLSNNNISDLPVNVFLENRQLIFVDVSSNNIDHLARDVFNGTKTLETLLLNNNSIDSLPAYIFRHMYNLRDLQLQNNRISGVLSNSLSGLASLRKLNMSGNQITSLPLAIFDPLGLVERLSVSDNVISRVERNPFQSMKNLVTLEAANNRIPAVSADWFTTTRHLETVKLEHNHITSIEMGTFADVPSLAQLDLSDNRLSNVDGLFSNCSALEDLNLAVNPLRRLPSAGSSFAGLTSLRRLNLTGTCLTEVSFQSAQLPNLQELYMQNNSLTNLSSTTFTGVSRVRHLHLGANDLDTKTIEVGTFASLTNLQTLNLTWNALTAGSHLTSLMQLSSSPVVDLTWNYLSTVGSLPSLPGGVYLYGNPIKCSCDASWLTSNVNALHDADRTTCLVEQSQTAELLVCHWQGCSSLPVTPPASASCFVQPADEASYLLAVRRAPLICPWDALNPIVEAPEKVGFVDVDVLNNSNSIRVRWNVSDTATEVNIRVTLVSGNFPNVTGVLTNGSDSEQVVGTYDYGVNSTDCVIGNLTSGQSYTVCVEVLSADKSASSDYTCVTVTLPLPLTTTSTVPTSSTTVSTTVALQMSTTATDSTVHVTWSLTSGSADSVKHFRLTWTASGDDSVAVRTMWLEGDQFSQTLKNLTESTVYHVCIQTFAKSGYDSDNRTSCRDVTTAARPVEKTDEPVSKMLIIIIAVAVGALVLIIIIILIIVICCCRRRRKNAKEQPAKPNPTSITVQPSESTRSTQSIRTSRLPEHTSVSVSVYEDLP